MKTINLTCDNCDSDLTDAGRGTKYRLVLACEEIPSTSGVRTLSIVYPPLKHTHHFCGLDCLREYLEET